MIILGFYRLLLFLPVCSCSVGGVGLTRHLPFLWMLSLWEIGRPSVIDPEAGAVHGLLEGPYC